MSADPSTPSELLSEESGVPPGVGVVPMAARHGTSDRQLGALTGLAAGDKNLGPFNMALLMCDSLLDKGAFSRADIFLRFLGWYHFRVDDDDASSASKKPRWSDRAEGAEDTGIIGMRIFGTTSPELFRKLGSDGRKDKWIIEQASRVDSQMKGMTAGVNAAHRSCILAMFTFPISSGAVLIQPAGLSRVALDQAQMTHWNLMAGQVSGVVCELCRLFIAEGVLGILGPGEVKGDGVAPPASSSGTAVASSCEGLSIACRKAVRLTAEGQGVDALDDRIIVALSFWEKKKSGGRMTEGGFSPSTLRNALVFVAEFFFFMQEQQAKLGERRFSSSLKDSGLRQEAFKTVMRSSFEFSGSSNYTPVLVGAMLGALVGDSGVPVPSLSHHSQPTVARLRSVQDRLRQQRKEESPEK